MKFIKIVIISLLFTNPLFAQTSIDQFLGPKVGVKYVYYFSSGTRIEQERVSVDKSGKIRIKETTYLPKELTPEGFPTETTHISELYIFNDMLIQEDEKGRKYILLKAPLEATRSTWTNHVCRMEESGCIEIATNLKITTILNEKVHGQNRQVITVQSIMYDDKQDTTHVIRYRYAQDIGLIEAVFYGAPKNKYEDDEFKEQLKFELKEIQHLK